MTSIDHPTPAAMRRQLLKSGVSASLLIPLLGTGLLTPARLLAAEWQQTAFTANNIGDALKAWGAGNAAEAQQILARQVEAGFFGQFAPDLLPTAYGPEIWQLYERGMLSPDVVLTGRYERKAGTVDLGAVMREIDAARDEEAARRLRMS